MKRFFCIISLVLLWFNSMANVTLPKYFSDKMVLQRNHAIPVWGWAGSKEKITVQLHNQTKTVDADKAGKWRIDLFAEEAGGPYTLTVKGKNTINITNVLIGDVWVCSGQSNMEMKIEDWGFINNYEAEIAAANYPNIRQFEVTKATATRPKQDVAGGTWQICSPTTAGNFSATAYFFARKIYQETNIPVGLINTSWGGTQVESWISSSGLAADNEFKDLLDKMPTVDIDELIKRKEALLVEKIKAMQPNLPISTTEIDNFNNKDYNDSSWKIMKVPGLWEQQGLDGFDGNIWFRITIQISSTDAGKSAQLHLGTIDDDDDTYVNLVKVGATKGYNVARNYDIPVGVLKAGKNIIAVLVHDSGGGGGIYGEPNEISLTIDGKKQPLAGSWQFRIEKMNNSSLSLDANSYPSLLYNGMIQPLIPYAIKGAIWYQGEANVYRAYQYRKAFPLMITDWRRQWQQGDFPFYFVQLSSWNENNGNSNKGSLWAELREAQAMTLSLPNTGMAVTTDIGDAKDIHPKNKQDVGKRLAAIALNKTYKKGNVFTGPTFSSFTIEAGKILISFTNTGSGLLVKDAYGYIKGFEIAGADQKFYYAKALIEGDHVVVFQDGVDKPVAVRFGWADDAGINNLFNQEGFPAAPFRTDNWKGITENVKFKIGD